MLVVLWLSQNMATMPPVVDQRIIENVHKTVDEMMVEGRGYRAAADCSSDASEIDYKVYRKSNGAVVAAIFVVECKLGIKEFKRYSDFLLQLPLPSLCAFFEVIFFTESHFSTNVSQECAKLKRSSKQQIKRISNYLYKYYTFNITKHKLYRPHVLLTEEEEARFFAENGSIGIIKMPKLRTSDRVCQFFDFKVGSVVRIERNYGNSNLNVQYRVVVPPDDDDDDQ